MHVLCLQHALLKVPLTLQIALVGQVCTYGLYSSYIKKSENHINIELDPLKVMMLLRIGDIRKYIRCSWAQSSSLHDEMLDTCNDVCTMEYSPR